MTRQEVFDKLQTIIIDQTGCESAQIHDGAEFAEDLDCDSLDGVELMMAVEEQFDIEIPDEDGPELLGTVGLAVDYIHGKLNG